MMGEETVEEKINDLKVKGYDCISLINEYQNRLNQINQRVSQLYREKEIGNKDSKSPGDKDSKPV